MATQGRDPNGIEQGAEWEAIARYLAGESTPAEAELIERRLSHSDEEAALVAAVRRATEHIAADPVPGLDVERALARVRSRIADKRVRPLSGDRARWRFVSESWGRWVAAAAAVVVISATTVLLRERRGDDPGRIAESGARTYASPVGARDSIRLADGTRVLLGPGSTLEVKPGYGASHRDVSLRGEAFVEAVHGIDHPFTVYAGAAAIRDVGTAFAVHSDFGTGVRVVVTTGAVLMRRAAGDDEGTLLRAGDVGLLARGDSIVARRGGATPDDLAWTRGELVFRDASMEDVRADVRRWYGIELVVADSSLARQHFNSTFHNDAPDVVLRVIASAFGARIERHGDTAIVRRAREGNTR